MSYRDVLGSCGFGGIEIHVINSTKPFTCVHLLVKLTNCFCDRWRRGKWQPFFDLSFSSQVTCTPYFYSSKILLSYLLRGWRASCNQCEHLTTNSYWVRDKFTSPFSSEYWTFCSRCAILHPWAAESSGRSPPVFNGNMSVRTVGARVGRKFVLESGRRIHKRQSSYFPRKRADPNRCVISNHKLHLWSLFSCTSSRAPTSRRSEMAEPFYSTNLRI